MGLNKPRLYAQIAQLAELLPVKRMVVGSSPTLGALRFSFRVKLKKGWLTGVIESAKRRPGCIEIIGDLIGYTLGVADNQTHVDHVSIETLKDASDMLNHQYKRIESLELEKQRAAYWMVLTNCSNAGVYCSACHAKMFDHYPMQKKSSVYCGHCGSKMQQNYYWKDGQFIDIN